MVRVDSSIVSVRRENDPRNNTKSHEMNSRAENAEKASDRIRTVSEATD